VTDFFPRIGDYDNWAIEWGYKNFPDAKSAEEEKKLLNELTKEKVKNPRLTFGTEVSPSDPRYQTEDLGDNSMKASDYGIKNLKRILPNLNDWTKENGESYSELEELYNNVVAQYRRYMGHVTKNVGGIYDTPKTYDTPGAVYETVPKDRQKEAVAFLNAQLFETPTWMLDENVVNKIRPDVGVESIKAIQDATLSSLLSGDRVVRLLETGKEGAYTLDDLMTDLRAGIWSELKTQKSIDIFRRNLQKVFVERAIGLLSPKDPATISYVPPGQGYGFVTRRVDLKTTDLPSITRGHLEALLSEIRAAISAAPDKLSRYHLEDVANRIDTAVHPK
jgi:hypothetical protein